MSYFRKQDVKVLYDSFIKICDYIEQEVGCSKCPLWKDICSHPNSLECDDFANSLNKIKESIS